MNKEINYKLIKGDKQNLKNVYGKQFAGNFQK